MLNGVPNGTGPTTAAFDAATPKMSTGIVNGITRIASRRPPRRRATVRAAPMRPMKVSAGVPASKVSATAPVAFGSRLSRRPRSGAAMTSGRPVVSQCASALAASASSSGARAVRIRSSEPSS
jgi:hypothetical protein